ncbi:hypothetical protein HPP92_027419 [Vanilla planifolia]|uniref:Uncharacterized protein n=1 Tax=Vanilla planifolia TaxID=51239 RepID=A0A835U622_VANPL|nr:hypothetical protein HPP92_027419 [Vanilla planifolia]
MKPLNDMTSNSFVLKSLGMSYKYIILMLIHNREYIYIYIYIAFSLAMIVQSQVIVQCEPYIELLFLMIQTCFCSMVIEMNQFAIDLLKRVYWRKNTMAHLLWEVCGYIGHYTKW